MQQKIDSVTAIKSWLFPAIVTILATIIWRDVTELKNDVKQLLAQSNVDKTKIEGLQKQVDILNQRILNQPVQDPQKQASYLQNSKEFILNEQRKKKYAGHI